MTSTDQSTPAVLHPTEVAERQRAIVLRVVRVTFLILIVTFTMLDFLRRLNEPGATELPIWLPFLASLVLFGLAIVADLVTPNKKISTILGILVGIIAGMLATLALGFLTDLLLQSWVPESEAFKALKPVVNSIKILVGITLCYLGVTTVLQTQDDFRLVIPYVEFAKQLRGMRPMLMDSSVLIDGRVVDIAITGFLQAPILIPHFVVAELQTLADSSDGMKRAKGRRGLEVIAKLQRQPRLDVTIDDTPVPGLAVDQMLVELGRVLPAIIVTTDLGLARVANIQSVGVVNLNDLANALKSTLVPGEQLTIKLMRQGEQAGQAVGYLPDGTMVVAEDGSESIGQTVALAVTSSLQTSAGRLIFARLVSPPPRTEAHDVEAPSAQRLQPDAPQEAAQHPEAPSAIEGATEQAPPEVPRVRSPFPPNKPRSMKAGSPRNPRR